MQLRCRPSCLFGACVCSCSPLQTGMSSYPLPSILACAPAVLLTSPRYPSIRCPCIFSIYRSLPTKTPFPTGGSEHYELDCRFKLKTVMQFPFLLSSFYSQNFTVHCRQVFTRKLVAGSKISGYVFARENACAEMNSADMLSAESLKCGQGARCDV